ncbi:hypothetical protein AB0C96_37675 [Streptomyces sp. NPDC048506]|uniref:hypothetical protein n=1 Tax=Streptomyces sp. NPDC048506 TaxID=3155028 RepID=UPI003448F831
MAETLKKAHRPTPERHIGQFPENTDSDVKHDRSGQSAESEEFISAHIEMSNVMVGSLNALRRYVEHSAAEPRTYQHNAAETDEPITTGFHQERHT